MLPIFSRIQEWWTAADRNQRTVTLGGVGALLLLLGGTAFFATRPQYEPLADGLSDLEQAQDVDALTAAGIPAQAGPGGTIRVPKGQRDEAKMKLALAGKLPKGSAHLSFPDLKSLGPMASPEVEAQTIKAIQEGEIASALETMEGVAKATVLITKPRQSVFAQDEKPATASVTIAPDGKGALSAANGRVIANLVCASVEGMSLENVYVSSNSLGVLFDGHNGDSGGTKAELDAKVARDWEAKVQAALSPLGADNFRVAVRADVDTARRHVQTDEVTPTERPTTTTKRKETMQGAARRPGGMAGSVSNGVGQGAAPATPPAGATKDSAYEGTESHSDYGTSSRKTDEQSGTGDLKGLAISVVANSEKITNPADVQKVLDGLLGGLVQRDAARAALPNQPFSATVASVKFDGEAAAAAKAAADAAAGRQRTQQILSLLPIAAILVVALLVARQVGKISKAVLPATSVMASGAAVATESAPAAMTGGGGPDALPMSAGGGADEEPAFVLEPIRNRVDPSLEGLKQMASDRPEMVATLIKSMLLNGERA